MLKMKMELNELNVDVLVGRYSFYLFIRLPVWLENRIRLIRAGRLIDLESRSRYIFGPSRSISLRVFFKNLDRSDSSVSQSVCSVLAQHAHLYLGTRRCLPTATQRKDNSMSDTGEERELQRDQIVDKKRFVKSMIWNWYGYFKNDKAQKTTACVSMWRVDQDGKHEQPIEAPETVAPSDYTWGCGAKKVKKEARICSKLCSIVLHCKRYDAFLAKNQ